MSAWNLSAEKYQVATEIVIVIAVKSEAVPRCLSASTYASTSVMPSCISCLMRSKR